MEETQPQASVIVAVRNAEETLEACVRSLLDLDYPAQRELICVDNGSADGSSRILESFAGSVRVLREQKPGAAAARNRGIREARFSVIAFTDADCMVHPQWLRHLVAPLADPLVGASGGPILARQPCNAVEAFGEVVHDNQKAITQYQPPFVDSGNWASRKSVLEQLDGFDEAFLRGQDVELSCRMLQAGFKFAYASAAIVYHRNERTWRGLFHEGFTHGMHNVALVERHRAFYERFGYRPRSLRPYRQLWGHLRNFVSAGNRGGDRSIAACNLVFNAGKRMGRVAGSIRRGRLHL